jgi:hypothetical protein
VKEFPWTSDDALDAERIATWKKIPLTILRIAKDSLKVSRTIGTFKDSLTITRYEAQLKRETILAKCKYDWRGDEGFLHLLMNDTDNLKYRFTLVSTGSFILLTRKSGKKVMQKL